MGVRDRNEESVWSIHFLIQFVESVLSKVNFIEDKVHMFLSVLNVHPENVHREPKLSEVPGSLS